MVVGQVLEGIETGDNPQEMRIAVEGPVAAGVLTGLEMNEGLDHFRSPGRQKEALIDIARSDRGLVFVARADDEITGYVTFVHPGPYTRWGRHSRLLQLGEVEVGRTWRRCYVASRLLRAAFSCPLLDHWIVIALEYCRHWDLSGTGLGVWEYRDMLTKLFGRAGLAVKNTDDPDIAEHPASLMMARVGGKVPHVDAVAFEALLWESGANVKL